MPQGDRDRRGGSFGRKRSRIAAGRDDNGHATADEVGHEQLQAVRPPVLDSDILALDEPELAKALAECSRPPPSS
jgi:hypothetical protein